MITLSVVSHRQAGLVAGLLRDIVSLRRADLEVILTVNLPETLGEDVLGQLPPLKVIRNARPLGFAANHNAAFRASHGEYFCVMNPDIRMTQDPFPALLEALRAPRVALAAPRIVAPDGSIEDSARRFPTWASLLRKLANIGPRLDYAASDQPSSPDWIAGMFMLFRREDFAGVGGFDECYHLYYEDVDICRRLRLRGRDIRLLPQASVTHDAQRASRRDLAHMLWHARSMLRFLTTRYR